MKRCCLARSSRPKAPWGSPWCSNPLLSLRHAPRRHQSLGRLGGHHGEEPRENWDVAWFRFENWGFKGISMRKMVPFEPDSRAERGFIEGKNGFDRLRWMQLGCLYYKKTFALHFCHVELLRTVTAPLGEEASWQVLTLCRSDILKLKLLIGRSTFSMCFDQISPLAKLTEGKDMSHALMQMIGGNIWADEMKGGGPNESTRLNLNPMWIFYRGWDWCPFLGLFGHHQNSHICWNWNIPILVGWCPPSWGEHPMDGLQPSIGCSMGHPSCKLVSKPHQHPLVNSYIYHKPYLSQL